LDVFKVIPLASVIRMNSLAEVADAAPEKLAVSAAFGPSSDMFFFSTKMDSETVQLKRQLNAEKEKIKLLNTQMQRLASVTKKAHSQCRFFLIYMYSFS
jgi:hypothetical protein